MKKSKTRTCGKCKTAFPVGKGHNVRTCGKTEKILVFPANMGPPSAITLKNVPARETYTKKRKLQREELLNSEVGLKKEFFYVEVDLHEVLIQETQNDMLKKLSNTHYLSKYTHVTDGETTAWFNKKGLLHRLDGPAVERIDRDRRWYIDGKLHRLDGPAVEYLSGHREWWLDGKRHRLDGPAVEYADGRKEWWVNNKRHRLDGPAEEHPTGVMEWWVNGKLHRVDGPAVITRVGNRKWYKEHKLHRLDGPAVEGSNGVKGWWVNNIKTTNEVLCEKALQQNLTHEELYPLCTHEDYVVREIAMNHPNCPLVWKVAGKLMKM